MNLRRSWMTWAAAFGIGMGLGVAAADAHGQATTWATAKTLDLGGVSVAVSKPVLVARSRDWLWFPTLIGLENGDLLAVMSNTADVTVKPVGSAAWSSDGGLTWRCDKPIDGLYSDHSAVRLANGDRLLLPFYLFTSAGTDRVTGGCPIVRKGSSAIEMLKDAVSVSGWPRRCGSFGSFGPGQTLAGFGFNGQTVELEQGGFLATLYGRFEGAARYSLLAAESADAKNWRIRSVIADDTCALEGAEGPCEAALCRLKDGRLMCVFRNFSDKPYGQCWSGDGGRTWTKPAAMAQSAVQPSLMVMKDGTVTLSGGRPGVFVWIDPTGMGTDWRTIDVAAIHKACHPAETIDSTTSYTELVALDERHLLLIYDRIPHGWNEIPAGSQETNSVWVVRLELSR